MDQSACKLTLIYPPASESHITELMMNSEPSLAGFTTFEAEGHGSSFSKASMRERVRGRVGRRVLVLVLPRPRVAPLLEEIRTKASIPELVYWVEPIEAFGRLTRAEPQAADAPQSAA